MRYRPSCRREIAPSRRSLATILSMVGLFSKACAASIMAAAGILVCESTAVAQPPATVQLPMFSSFSMSDSVLVPDRGSTLLGAVGSQSNGQLSRGVPGASHLPGAGRLFKNQSLGRDAGHSSLRASAWVHDFRAMDEALLEEARQTASSDHPSVIGPKNFVLSRSTSESGPADDSVAAIRHEREERRERLRRQADSEARSLLAEGDQARADGKPGVAKICYQMAARRASDPQLAAEVETRLRNQRGQASLIGEATKSKGSGVFGQ